MSDLHSPPGEAPNSQPTVPQADRIVSVNSRSVGSGRLLGKVIFVISLLVVLGVGGLMIYGRIAHAGKETATAGAAGGHTENRAAGIAQRRTFASEDPGRVNDHADDPSKSAGYAKCPNGAAPRQVFDQAGKPIYSGGVALRACDDGGFLVPAIESEAPPLPGAVDTVSGSHTTSPAKGGVQTERQQGGADRYHGDVILSGSGPKGRATPQTDSAFDDPLMRLALSQVMASNPSDKVATGHADLSEVDSSPPDSLGRQLGTSKLGTVTAALLGDRNMIIPKGKTIDCGLSMRLISEVAGMASCVLTQNVYSDNGRVVLLERGSEAVGEYRATMAQGQRRLFVVWSRIKTPGGVVITLDSPGADALGTTGLMGHIENHWWQRVGSAFLLSSVQDVIAHSAAARSEGASRDLVLQNTQATGNRMAERVLESTIHIKPTLYKTQGDRGAIYVARDLNFGSVYDLRAQ